MLKDLRFLLDIVQDGLSFYSKTNVPVVGTITEDWLAATSVMKSINEDRPESTRHEGQRGPIGGEKRTLDPYGK